MDLVRTCSSGRESCDRDGGLVVIAYEAMTYQVHRPDRTGRMQEADAELGPRRGGVVLEVRSSSRPYGGPMELPQWLRGPYYDTHCSEVKEGDTYSFVRARFGADFPADVRERILDRVGAVHGPPSAVRVGLVARAEQARFGQDGPLALKVALRNGLARPIRFLTFATEPSDSNGETLSVDLVDIYRDGELRNLYLARPELKIPRTISGPASLPVAAGGELVVRLDARKWAITGGWTPGDYAVTVRLRNIDVDGKVTLAVLSDPVRFVVE